MLLGIMAEPVIEGRETRVARRRGSRAWGLLLVLPYLGLCFPQMYVRASPVLWGFPFFYWYQFGWVLLTSGLLGIYYLKMRQTS
jgi:hypothetical protein